MPRSRSSEDLSFEELRQLLVDKQRGDRARRIEAFKRSGRVISLEPVPAPSVEAPTFLAAVEEMATTEQAEPAPLPRRRRRRTWVDQLLLGIELAAVVGLIFIAITGVSILNNLNKEVASALVLPTLTPTALIRAVVLPAGHTPPDAPGGAQFNYAEVPDTLQPMVASLANLPVPTSSPQQAVRLQVPAIKVDSPVVQGDGWEQLKKGVGQHIGTPNPGQKGNIVLSAHNDIFGEIFRDLDQLKPGDTVILFTTQRTYTYTVRQTQIVEPTRVEVMAPTSEAVITLISCYPYRVDNKRFVVTAALQDN